MILKMKKYQCVLYNCKSLNNLTKYLCLKDKQELQQLKQDIKKDPFKFFKPFTKNNRELFICNLKIKLLHRRLMKLFQVEVPSYLKSGIKKQSHITNVQAHAGNNFFLLIDIQGFYPSITKSKIKHQLIRTYNQSSNVAEVISNLVTVPQIKANSKRALVTGSVLSQYFAFVINKKMFDELYEVSQQNNITFSVYVDDITFSSKTIISYQFHQKIYSIIKKYGYTIHQGKIYRGKIGSKSTITGIHITKYGFRLLDKHRTEIKRLIALGNCKKNKRLQGLINYSVQVNPKYFRLKAILNKK